LISSVDRRHHQAGALRLAVDVRQLLDSLCIVMLGTLDLEAHQRREIVGVL